MYLIPLYPIPLYQIPVLHVIIISVIPSYLHPSKGVHSEGWQLAPSVDWSCHQVCSRVGLSCSKAEQHSQNSDVISKEGINAVMNTVGKTCVTYVDGGTYEDVPGMKANDQCFTSSSSRTASQYSCTHSQYQMYRLCYCSRYCSITPCLEGEGDCGADSECEGSLVCGHNNCANNITTHCCMKTLLKTESTLVTASTTLITTVTPTESPSSIAATSTTAPTTANNKFTTSITKTTNKCKKTAWAIYSITTTATDVAITTITMTTTITAIWGINLLLPFPCPA